MKSLSKIVHGVALWGLGSYARISSQAFSLGYRILPRWGKIPSISRRKIVHGDTLFGVRCAADKCESPRSRSAYQEFAR